VIADATFEARCIELGFKLRRLAQRLVVELEGDAALQDFLEFAIANKVRIIEVAPRQETLEELFVREALEPGQATHNT
jgi:ABC-2 type transport system ATP-binding protein